MTGEEGDSEEGDSEERDSEEEDEKEPDDKEEGDSEEHDSKNVQYDNCYITYVVLQAYHTLVVAQEVVAEKVHLRWEEAQS